MRKSIGFLILILSVVATTVFFVLLNFSFFVHEAKLKSILAESNFYETAALYVKNEIVTKSDFKLNEGSNFEDLNQKITGASIKPVIDDTIHNIFNTIDSNPQQAARIFPIQFDSQKDSGTQFSFEKYVNLQQNKFYDILAKRNYYLLLSAVGLLLLVLVGLLIFSSKISDRLIYVFIYCLLTLLLLSGTAALINFYLPNYVDLIVNKSQFIKEPKLVATAKKLIAIIINGQTIYYLAEIIGLLIVGVTALTIKKVYMKEKLDQIGEKI